MGAGQHRIRLGGAGANHFDLDAGIGGHGGSSGHRRHGERDQAFPDGGLGFADDADTADQAASSYSGGASDRGHAVGRMLPFPAAGAARPADRIHSWARRRSGFGLPDGDHDRLWPGGQPVATAGRRHPDADATRFPVLHRAQLPGSIRCYRADIGAGAVSAGFTPGQRRRYPRQRCIGRHHRLWRTPVANPSMSHFIGDWHALVILLVAGVIPNQIWRMLGLWFGGGIDEGSELLVWVRAVATAILAGVIAQIVVQPPGALASVPGWLRYSAVAAGFAVFMVTRRSIFAGVICGEIVMLAGKWWLG